MKYWAFLSYSHQDNLQTRADGSRGHILWAEWLHDALETYRVPAEFRSRQTRTGEPMPERFYPVFQDEKELPINADLGASIRTALRESRFLIVICSPRSATSRYVNEEVRYFEELGRQNRIMTLMIDGEPNVGFGNKPGFSPNDECFCPALRHPLDANNQVDLTRTDAQEPIAGDVRIKDSVSTREPVQRDIRAQRASLDYTKLKLLAGLMGVGVDELVHRDKERQLREERAKAGRLRRLVAAFAVLAIIAVTAGAIAFVKQREAAHARDQAQVKEQEAARARDQAQIKEQEATRARDEARAQLSNNYLDKGLALLSAGDRMQGCANLVAALRANPYNTWAADRLFFELNYGDWLIPAAVVPIPEELRESSKTHEETLILKAKFLDNQGYLEVSTLDFDGDPARVYEVDLQRNQWKLLSDRRRPRGSSKFEFPKVFRADDYEAPPKKDSPEVKKLTEIVGTIRTPMGLWTAGQSLYLSDDRHWAATVGYNGDAYPADQSPVVLVDWENGRLIDVTNTGELVPVTDADAPQTREQQRAEEGTGQQTGTKTSEPQTGKPTTAERLIRGLPAFDAAHSIVWLFRRSKGSQFSSELEAIDLAKASQIFITYLRRSDSFEPLRPRVLDSGTRLVVRYTINNRPGEVLSLFGVHLDEGIDGKKIKLDEIADSLIVPGILGEVSKDGRRLAGILPDSLVVYELLSHRLPEGTAVPEQDRKYPFSFSEDFKIEPLSADGTLKADGDMRGHFVIFDQTSRSNVASFESETFEGVDGNGRRIRQAEFSPDSRWLVLWGEQQSDGIDDTEIYDPRSGRLIFPRFSNANQYSFHSDFDAIRELTADGRSAILLNGQTIRLRLSEEPVPIAFAQVAEAIIGAYIDERGVYHVAGTSGARPCSSISDLRKILAKLDPSSPWTRFANDRLSSVLTAH